MVVAQHADEFALCVGGGAVAAIEIGIAGCERRPEHVGIPGNVHFLEDQIAGGPVAEKNTKMGRAVPPGAYQNRSVGPWRRATECAGKRGHAFENVAAAGCWDVCPEDAVATCKH